MTVISHVIAPGSQPGQRTHQPGRPRRSGWLGRAAALAVFVSIPAAAQQAPTHDAGVAPPDTSVIVRGEVGASIDAYTSRMAAFGLSGSLLVEKDGQVIVQKSYGLANREHHIPMRPEMPLNVGSLSKQFTAAAILKLEMEGRLRTSDTLGRFFPAAPADKRGITLHQLLTHTSGLPYLWSADIFAPWERDSVTRHVLALPLVTPPGQVYAYSNPGYTLLGLVIEQASGMTYNQYLREHLFAPAGMTHTSFYGEERSWPGGTPMHSYNNSHDEGGLDMYPISPMGTGAGTVISTITDMYRWELALRAGQILSPDAVARMFKRHVPTQGTTSYGYGWNIGITPRGTTVIVHAGDLGGYNSEMRRYPEEAMTIVFLSNARVDGEGYRLALMNNMRLMITGAKHLAVPSAQAPDSASLATLNGTYRLPGGGAFTARATAEGLVVAATGGDALHLLSGPPPADSSTPAKLADYTGRIVEGAGLGDMQPMRDVLFPAIPPEQVAMDVSQQWSAVVDSLGKYVRTELIGTVFKGASSAHTFARVHFQRGSRVAQLTWTSGQLVAIALGAEPILPTTFLRGEGAELVAFDPFSGRTIRMTLDETNRQTAMVFATESGRSVRATRS